MVIRTENSVKISTPLEYPFNNRGHGLSFFSNDQSNPAEIFIFNNKTDDTFDNQAVKITPHLSLPMIRSHQSQTTLQLIAIKDVISELGQSARPDWLQSERWPGNWWWISVHWFVLIASCEWILGGMRSHCWGLNSIRWQWNVCICWCSGREPK